MHKDSCLQPRRKPFGGASRRRQENVGPGHQLILEDKNAAADADSDDVCA
jgi:hypothetical protein